MARHDERPQQGERLSDADRNRLEEMMKSGYASHIRDLKPILQGKSVVSTTAGSSGYQLIFEDGTWVICFLLGNVMDWRCGRGPLSALESTLLNSSLAGDAREPQRCDFIYAGERCDLATEVANCRGKSVSGVAIGADCFSICFPDGMELDGTVRKDNVGRASLRVYWEQW